MNIVKHFRMNLRVGLLLSFLFAFLQGPIHAQDETKEEKLSYIFNLTLAADMRKPDSFFPDFGFRMEPTRKMRQVHWYGQLSVIKGSYTTFQPDTTLSFGFTGGISLHPSGQVFIGIGGGPFLLSDEGKKRFFWGFTPHIGFETYRFKVSLGVTILQKRTYGVDVFGLTVGRKFTDD